MILQLTVITTSTYFYCWIGEISPDLKIYVLIEAQAVKVEQVEKMVEFYFYRNDVTSAKAPLRLLEIIITHSTNVEVCVELRRKLNH